MTKVLQFFAIRRKIPVEVTIIKIKTKFENPIISRLTKATIRLKISPDINLNEKRAMLLEDSLSLP